MLRNGSSNGVPGGVNSMIGLDAATGWSRTASKTAESNSMYMLQYGLGCLRTDLGSTTRPR